jgi:hypothetical protein
VTHGQLARRHRSSDPLVVEYYNPVPVAGEIMDRHSHMCLVDYGFVYRRDPNFLQDDAQLVLA